MKLIIDMPDELYENIQNGIYDMMETKYIVGWVPMSEKEPEKDDENYLITIKEIWWDNSEHVSIRIAPFYKKHWLGVSTRDKVLAWMPLPDMFKEKEETK